METQTLALGVGLFLVGFVLGRFSAPRARGTVVYESADARGGRAAPGGAERTGGSAADAEIEAAVRAGQKIEAIKRYREAYGTGLKEAKDAVEAMEARLRR